jgi:hypothetical protein
VAPPDGTPPRKALGIEKKRAQRARRVEQNAGEGTGKAECTCGT